MKVVHEELVIDAGGVGATKEFASFRQEIYDAVSKIVWPSGSSEFSIYPGKHANGVGPMKSAFVQHLVDLGWKGEERIDLAVTKKQPGALDVVSYAAGKPFAVEWETGNVSSSYRALNKLSIGIMRGILLGGALVVPSGKLYPYLTDRIGNYPEIEPYFYMYERLPVESGVLAVIVVEHDLTSEETPKIVKGTDGRALR